MPVIDAGQRTRECDALMDAAVAARHDEGARVVTLRACAAHPCAYHELDLPELFGTLAETLGRLERYDESLEAWEAAIAAGARGLPHPRTNVAEVLLRAGRRDEADAVLAELRRQCPEDIWLYNAAGFSYALVGEHEAALPWLEDGIVMALADGDPEGIVHQLDEERTRCRRRSAWAPTNSAPGCRRSSGPATGRCWAIPTERCSAKHIRIVPRAPTAVGTPRTSRPTGMHLDELEWLADNLNRRAAVIDRPGAPHRVAKVGRNATCPCGSGRKHKHCCGR
jgi:tetratricopeptide (TPR) repeat protein